LEKNNVRNSRKNALKDLPPVQSITDLLNTAR